MLEAIPKLLGFLLDKISCEMHKTKLLKSQNLICHSSFANVEKIGEK